MTGVRIAVSRELEERLLYLPDLALYVSLRDFEEWAREAREIRRRSADWDFIERQPEPIRTALKVLVETGDLWVAAKIAGMSVADFNEVRLRAKVPIVV